MDFPRWARENNISQIFSQTNGLDKWSAKIELSAQFDSFLIVDTRIVETTIVNDTYANFIYLDVNKSICKRPLSIFLEPVN